MADRVEAQQTVVELFGPNRDGEPINFTVAAGTQISVGIAATLSSPRTATKVASVKFLEAVPGAGVSNAEKKATDGSVDLGFITQAHMRTSASGAITVGRAVSFTEANHIAQVPEATVAASGAIIVGYALETVASAAVGNKCSYRLDL